MIEAWPPRASGAAAAPAFAREQTPVLTQCSYCGTEIGYGPDATRLDVELRTCSACPPDDARRAAIVKGIAVGAHAGDGHDTTDDGESVLISPPYPFASPCWHAWKQGWWAGYFASDDDPDRSRARFAFDVQTGSLRPPGGAR